jgi:hypothetical protein
MPNWVSNTITLKGPEPVLKDIFIANFHFQKLHPCPFYNEETKKASDGWYEWCVAHWGTKWGASDVNWKSVKEEELVVTMDTAWEPPSQILAYLTLKNPGLVIQADYIDEGWGFVGTLICSGGIIERTQIEPHNYKPSALAKFAQGVTWFDFPSFMEELQEYGVNLGEVEGGSAYSDGPVKLISLNTTYEEYRQHSLQHLNHKEEEEGVEVSKPENEHGQAKPDNHESGV